MFGVKMPRLTHWLCAMYGHSYSQAGKYMICTVCGDKVKVR